MKFGFFSLLMLFHIFSAVSPQPVLGEIDPGQIYSLARPALTCKFQDDMEIAARYLEREDKEMLEHLLKKGACRFDDRGLQVKIKGGSKYRIECIEVQAIGETMPFWTMAYSLDGFVDNQFLPELRAKAQAAAKKKPQEEHTQSGKNQVMVEDKFAFRNSIDWQARAEKLVSERKVDIGMNKDQVQRAWGQPLKKESRLQKGGALQIWHFNQGYQIVFEDDIVKHIYAPKQ